MIFRYFKIWWLYSKNTFLIQLAVRWAVVIFLIAKILRFVMFTFFIVLLLNNTKVLAGYNLNQTIIFFLSFNLIDIVSQMVFREVYRFRNTVVSGNFDFYLIKPANPLFRALFGGPDILDFLTLIPLIIAIVIFVSSLPGLSILSLASYLILLIVGFVISLAFHILVLSLAIVTTEIDHAVMVYRDIVSLGRMPIDIYKEPIRGLITFIIPVGLMMTFPAKALFGMLSPALIVYSFVFCFVILFASIKCWNSAVRRYGSASS